MATTHYSRFCTSKTFLALVIAASSVTGITQAQTRGGTLSAIVQPEPPILMLGLNQQAPTQYVAGKIYLAMLAERTLVAWSTLPECHLQGLVNPLSK